MSAYVYACVRVQAWCMCCAIKWMYPYAFVSALEQLPPRWGALNHYIITDSYSHLHGIRNSITETPKVWVQLPESQVPLHLYVRQYAQAWGNSCTHDHLTKCRVNLSFLANKETQQRKRERKKRKKTALPFSLCPVWKSWPPWAERSHAGTLPRWICGDLWPVSAVQPENVQVSRMCSDGGDDEMMRMTVDLQSMQYLCATYKSCSAQYCCQRDTAKRGTT